MVGRPPSPLMTLTPGGGRAMLQKVTFQINERIGDTLRGEGTALADVQNINKDSTSEVLWYYAGNQ